MAEYLGDGVYHIGKAERIWSCRKAVMDDAVAEVEPGIPPANARFGWFKGAIPTPSSEGGFYVVEFLDDQKVRVLAYVDNYGRAFTTETGFERPPAQPQDLFIALAEGSSNKGTIFVRGEDGNPLACAPFTKSGSGQNAKYTIGDTWYDFKNHGKRLHYYDLMTRAYLAFVYRPTLGKATLPFGIDEVYRTLAQDDLLPALNEVVTRANKAEEDHLVTVHPAVAKLSQRLISAGIPEIATESGDAELRLIRTAQYANTFFVRDMGESSTLPESTIWEIEAALNLFSLTESLLQVLQSKGELASLASCEDYLLETAAGQSTELELVSELPAGKPDGQWQARSRIAAGIENMALPLRVEARFKLDLPNGLVRFEMRVPDAQMIASLFERSENEAAALAERYAEQVGLLLVDIAMRSSARIERVELNARTLNRSGQEGTELFSASFDRDLYERSNGFKEERRGDPSALYESASDQASSASFDNIEIASPSLRTDPDRALSSELAAALGANTSRDLEIFFNAELRAVAERLADAIATATDTTDAVAKVRQIEEETLAQGSSARISAAFLRLLQALAEGTIDPHEQNTTVDCFLGEDECLQAYRASEALTETGEIDEAIQILSSAVAKIEQTGFFTDNETTVYRVFDSYAARLVYNQVKAGVLPVPQDCPILQDRGKETLLTPDSYAFCLFELAYLLCSKNQTEEAMLYAKRAIATAPTMSAGYRALGQIFVSKEDFVSARTALEHALILMTSPDDIAALYYHLAYALWKSGDPETGLACYIKALQTSNVVAAACVSEIEELQKDTALPLPLSEDIDRLLDEAGIPLVPTESMRTILEEGAIVALDEGFFEIARVLLSFVFRYRNDDALVGVLRSLETSLF